MTAWSPDSAPTIESPSLLRPRRFKQRSLVGLGRLAEGGHFAETMVVAQGDGKRLQEDLDQFGVARLELLARRRRQAPAPHQRPSGSASGPANTSALDPRRHEAWPTRRRGRRAVAHLAQLAPRQAGIPFGRPSTRCGRRRAGRRSRATPTATVSRQFRARIDLHAPAPGQSAPARASIAAIVSVDWLISMWRHASRHTSRRTVRNSSTGISPSVLSDTTITDDGSLANMTAISSDHLSYLHRIGTMPCQLMFSQRPHIARKNRKLRLWHPGLLLQ